MAHFPLVIRKYLDDPSLTNKDIKKLSDDNIESSILDDMDDFENLESPDIDDELTDSLLSSIEDEEDNKIITSVADFQSVVEGLENAGFTHVSAELTRIPENEIEITDPTVAKHIMLLIDKLEEHDDVQNVYANFDISDELMEQLDI